jgi:hypothetical protein
MRRLDRHERPPHSAPLRLPLRRRHGRMRRGQSGLSGCGHHRRFTAAGGKDYGSEWPPPWPTRTVLHHGSPPTPSLPRKDERPQRSQSEAEHRSINPVVDWQQGSHTARRHVAVGEARKKTRGHIKPRTPENRATVLASTGL